MKGWVEKKLGDVCTLQRGFDLPQRLRESGKYPLISSSGEIDSHSDFKVKAPGVVTGRSGSIGSVFYIEEDFWPLNTVLYVKDFHGNDARFVYYLLRKFDLGKFASGAGVPTLNRNHVHDEIVQIPESIEEQKRIVAILDEAFAGISQAVANAEKNLANARELFDSYLNEVFTPDAGRRVKLSEITTTISDGDHSPPPKSESGIPFITISNIDKNSREIDFTNTFKVPESYFSSLKENRKPRNGDVLYTVTGSFGIPVMVPDDVDFCFQRHIGLLRPKAGINSSWLYYVLMSPDAFSQATEGATGTAQKTVSLRVLRNIQVPLVDRSEQDIISGNLDSLWNEIKKMEGLYQRKLAALAELKQAILQKAFTGELITSGS